MSEIFFIYNEKLIESSKIYKFLSEKNGNSERNLYILENKKEENIVSKNNNIEFIEPQLSFKLNFIKGYNSANTISLNQIITNDAKSIIFTTYMVDIEWLIKTFPILKNIPVMIVHSHTNLGSQKINNIHLKRAYLPISYGLCHGKIIIVKYDNFLRIVVSTANLLEIDYDRKTQGLWVQDFPKINKDDEGIKSELAMDFKYTLHDYLTRLDLNADFLNNYSFNDVKIVLITSVPGYHNKDNLNNYGHLKVRKILDKYELHPKFKNSSMLAQISSIGSLSESWLKEIQRSFCGKNINENIEENIKIIWPTINFVKKSIDGYKAGSSLCFPKVNLKQFLKPLFYEYNSSFERENKLSKESSDFSAKAEKFIPPHIKCYTRENQGDFAWFLLTSSNLSTAAWGQLQKNDTQLFIRHYEIGVLFLPEENKNNIYPLPYTLPLEKNNDPWVWK